MNDRNNGGNPDVFKVDHRPISQAQLVAFGGVVVAIAVQSFALGVAWYDLKVGQANAVTKNEFQKVTAQVEEIERYRVNRGLMTDRNFEQIRSAIAPLDGMRFAQEQLSKEVAEQAEHISDTNQRVDRMVELLGGKLDNVIDSVNTLKSDVRLLSSKLDDQIDRTSPTKRTRFSIPFARPLSQPVVTQ